MTRRGRWMLVGLLAVGPGCSIAPRDFRGLNNPAPLVRARAVGLGRGLPDQVVIPALIARLEDRDPVVQMSAHEELKKRTGQDFGWTPWGEPAEKAAAIRHWRAWQAAKPRANSPAGMRRPR